MTARITDFARSYVRWSVEADPTDTRQPGHMPWGNSVRIQIDARCTIVESRTGERSEFSLIAPCRKEWMYRDMGLIMEPGAEYRVIFSLDRQLDVAMSARAEGDRPLPASTEGFQALEFEIAETGAVELETEAAVVRAAEGGRPIVARTRFGSRDGKRSALLEYPVRTMNYHPERLRFQVDTGPLIFAALETPFEDPIDCCRLAHTIYNRFDYAEFTCRPAGPLPGPTRNGTLLGAYSEIHQLPVETRLFAVPTPSS
jgi:hypothetical protein